MIFDLDIIGYMDRNLIKQKNNVVYPLIRGKDRLLIWEGLRGMWKNRKPDPIKELNKMRKGWDRKLI